MSSSFRNESRAGARNSTRRKRDTGAPSEARVSSLDTHIGYWLRMVSNHVSHAFKVKVEQHGVTVAEWVVLRALFDADGSRGSELSDTIGLTRGAVSKLLDRLSTKGLVTCRKDVRDRRSQVITLNGPGRRLVPKLAALADQNDAEVFGLLSAADQTALRRLLQRIAELRALTAAPIE